MGRATPVGGVDAAGARPESSQRWTNIECHYLLLKSVGPESSTRRISRRGANSMSPSMGFMTFVMPGP